MFYLRMLLLTILLPLSTSAEMLLTSSWTTNWVNEDGPDNFSIGQAYTVKVLYDETAMPYYNGQMGWWGPAEAYWVTGDTIDMTLSMPSAGVELTANGNLFFIVDGESSWISFYGYAWGDDVTALGVSSVNISIAFEAGDMQFDPLSGEPIVPTSLSQLPTNANFTLTYYWDEGAKHVAGARFSELDRRYYYGEWDNPVFVGEDGPSPAYILGEIDTATKSLTLEQVPEPSTWAAWGGLFILFAGMGRRHQRHCRR